MKRLFPAAALAILMAGAAVAAGVGLYPGATVDPELAKKAAEEAKAQGLPDTGATSEIATTSDPFEKVLAFYQAGGKEYRMPRGPSEPDTGYERVLPGSVKQGTPGVEVTPSGIRIKQAFVILDGAPDILQSRDWVTITRPFIFSARLEGTKVVYTDVRDVTAIVRVRK